MRVAEMKAREDFDALLTATLSKGWSDQLGMTVSVSTSPQDHSLEFRYHRFLGAYYTKHLGPRGRRFLRDSIRFTPQRRRLFAQWLATDLMANKIGLNLLSQDGFWLTPQCSDAHQWVVIPGNQRFRVFDFSTMRTRVFLKDGFAPHTMQREIELRSSGQDGPFQSITDCCPEGTFLEEPILEGWDMNRIPPWVKRKSLQNQARKRLLRWLERTQESVERADYVSALVQRINELAIQVRERYGDVIPEIESWTTLLQTKADMLPNRLVTGQTHGDFQWGNAFALRRGKGVVLIDWEHSGQRGFYYDFFTEALEARRFSLGSRVFTQRLRAYLAGKKLTSPIDDLGGSKRLGLLAVFLLETLYFFLHEALSGPYKTAPESLLGVVEQWPSVEGELRRSEGP